MQTTASLPAGRVRAFLEQRIEHDGVYMNRLLAIQMAAQKARSWRDLGDVIIKPNTPIEDDFGWSPPPEDDHELDYRQTQLFQQHRQAEAAAGLIFR